MVVNEQTDDARRLTGYDLMPFTKANVDAVIAHLTALQADRTITYAKLLRDTGIRKNAASLSRWITRKVAWDAIGKAGHESLVRYLIDRHDWRRSEWKSKIDAIPDALFHAVSSYLDISHATQDKTRQRAKGVFRVYYPSLTLKGRYVVGAALFGSDPQSNAVTVKLAFRYQPNESTPFTARPVQEAYDGYLFRKARKYFSLMRDSEKTHMRMEVYTDTFRVGEDIKIMCGSVMSVSENRSFHAPIYYEKIELAKNDTEVALFVRIKEESNIYDAEHIPEIVRAKLEGDH